MAETLATKYRPKDWNEVCSQETIIKILSEQVAQKKYKNAYLFAGSSGCGKTTTARIFADKINKGQGNPIEIDAASNNGVDNVRAIIDDAQMRALGSEYKIFIIDECHAITSQGWQAFLKCIEEPPTYTIFIFCTTEIQKVPETIKNRCQRYTFGRVSTELIKQRLAYICEQEHFTNYETGIEFIAKLADGGMRAAISYLDKCAGLSTDISYENVIKSLDHYPYDLFFRLMTLLFEGNDKNAIKAIEYFYNEGSDMKQFVEQFLVFTLDLAKYCLMGDCKITSIPDNLRPKMDAICSYTNSDKVLSKYMDTLLNLKQLLKNDESPKTTVEVVFLQMCKIGRNKEGLE